ncbi:glycogen synthase GlgA [Devosia pacifica]|uniref:glycogen synthase GlgA n=1 Tax=Devosia pacifica TaxID=1335967 RepID=UPI001AEDBFF7|nr:glycogen synthase GlgA [Devosia pacifica]
MEVLSVASEVYPLIKTGGLADVVGALPRAMAEQAIEMRTLIPGYPAVTEKIGSARTVARFDDLFGGPASLLACRVADLDLIVLDAAHLFDREGNPYTGPDGWDWPDNWRRFAALSFVAHRLSQGLVQGYQPHILHAHDWQAGLVPAYLKYGGPSTVRSVMTVHNLAFQGRFGSDIFGELQLPSEAYSVNGVEYYGGVGYLKAGLECADVVTTVSPSYASEIRTSSGGMGLEGLLNNRAATVLGILNGIDMREWDPAVDPSLTQTFSLNTLHKRYRNTDALRSAFSLEPSKGPLFGVVSRLTWQKGIDLLADAIDDIVARGGQLAVLGSGDAALETAVLRAAERHPGQVGLSTGFNEKLSHLMQGGADVILVPSRFEPCGLTQLYALRYGAVPLVSRVGGLNDTVIDANIAAVNAGVATGIQFAPPTEQALKDAIARVFSLWGDPVTWRKMQRRGMKSEVSWDASAARYADLYTNLLGLKSDDQEDD